jgi:hypothetical protein
MLSIYGKIFTAGIDFTADILSMIRWSFACAATAKNGHTGTTDE